MIDESGSPELRRLRQAFEAERRARRRLAALHAATRVLATADSVDGALDRILADVCVALDFRWAGFWAPEAAGSPLVCRRTHERPGLDTRDFTALSLSISFQPGEGLPGRVWQTGEPLWIEEVADDLNFPRERAAANVGLRGGFGFPVAVGAEQLGVMEFFSEQPLEANQELLDAMAGLGGQIALFMLRRRADVALSESEARFRAFAESLADAAFTIDEKSLIVFTNPAVERIFGWKPDQLIGQPLTCIIPERLRAAHRAGVRRHLETGVRGIPWEGVELPGLHRDGHEVPVEISFGSYAMDGRRFYTGIVRDVTERNRQRELLQDAASELESAVDELQSRTEEAESARHEAEQANRAKSDFLAVISHELRTPLNAILGYTDLLVSGIPEPLPDRLHAHVERVRTAGGNLLELIEEILTFSRVEAGREQIHVDDVDLRALLRDVASIAAPLAARKDIVFRVSDVPDTVLRTDPGKLRQILVNLISNAVKFTDSGEVELSAGVEEGGVLLRVRDTGIGIERENLARIFDAFWQAETAATRKQGGTGLGLSVSRKLARLLGGDIEVSSQPGAGSTFTVLIPRQPPAAGEPPT